MERMERPAISGLPEFNGEHNGAVPKQPTPPEARGDEAAPVPFSVVAPVVEKLGTGTSEAADTAITSRAGIVHQMMDKGTSAEKWPRVWRNVALYVAAAQGGGGSSDVQAYLKNKENAAVFEQLREQVQAGKPWMDILAREEYEGTAQSLQAVEVLSKVINDAIRTEGGQHEPKAWQQLSGAANGLSQHFIRVTEIANVYAKASRGRQGLLTPEEQKQAPVWQKQIDALLTSDDISESLRQVLKDVREAPPIKAVKHDIKKPTSPVKAEVERDHEQSIEQIPTAELMKTHVEMVEQSPGAESFSTSTIETPSPEPQSPTPEQSATPGRKPEKIFGREALIPDDITAASQEINKLLNTKEKEPTPDDVFEAARLMAHLKRAKVGVAEKHRERLFNKLLSQRETLAQDKPVKVAKYLTYLKYLGAIDSITDVERGAIEKGITERTSQGGITNLKEKDLSQLCVNAKYLGIERDYSALAPHIEQELEGVNKWGREEHIAYRLARAKYLGISSDRLKVIEEETRNITNSRLAEMQTRGWWGRFAALRHTLNYLRGERGDTEKLQERMVNCIATARKIVRQKGNWSVFFAYIGTLTALSQPQPRTDNPSEPQVLFVGATYPKSFDSVITTSTT